MRKFLVSMFLLTLITPVLSTQAQQTQPQPQTQNAKQQPLEVSDQKLKDYLFVHDQLLKVQNSYSNAIKTAQDNNQSLEPLKQQIQQDMVETVQNSKLSLEEFNRINVALQNSPELQQRLQRMIQK